MHAIDWSRVPALVTGHPTYDLLRPPLPYWSLPVKKTQIVILAEQVAETSGKLTR